MGLLNRNNGEEIFMVKKTAKKAKPKASKKVSKKPAAKKTAAKKTAAKKVAASAPVAKGLPKNLKFDAPATNSEIHNMIAEAVGITRKQVSSVFDCLSDIISGHVKKNAAGMCKVGGLMKIEVKRKPAVKARKGVSPFTGEEIMFKAKPARNVVKVKALKKLKEMAE